MNAPVKPTELNELDQVSAEYSLNDKYTLDKGRIYLSGSQALVRLMLLQARRDQLAGLNTAGFASGYRGSPLGGVDQAFWAARAHLEKSAIKFQPGLNEDLGATAVWGSQQVNLFEGAKVDGVFGLWYGKGPGVDRSMDVFKHANAAGTSRHGGVLLVAGDDHGAKSSTLPHQSDHVLKAAMMPVLFPSNLQEYLDLGVLGYAMSRYAGVWVGFKAIADTVESSASVIVDPERVRVQMPEDFELPNGGLNIRWPDPALDQEARLLDYKLYAALAFARANRINHSAYACPHARFGIVASGKAYGDTLQALQDLGLTQDRCRELGISLYKVGMVWPLEATGIREFARGLKEILVVEEKRQMIEYQIKEELYAWREDVRPKVYGKYDERHSEDGREGGEWSLPQGRWLLPTHSELDPALIAKAIARRLSRLDLPKDVRDGITQRIKAIRRREELSRLEHPPIERKPYFCSGCPHNTSTRVPEGSRAVAGIGCHYMAVWMDRSTDTFTQMGGEGVPWIGQAPFTETQHIFANLGDGTYFHSGILAIRASVAAQVNITYKILFNDAVAMTGGQPLDGHLTVPQLTRQLEAEGVRKTVVVTDDLNKYAQRDPCDLFAEGIQFYDRSELDEVQRMMREMTGTTVIIYEQTCASEKRRRRKRRDPQTGQPGFPDPLKRVVINPRVCEGCGDCSKQSNCLSIEPLQTEWGVKRTINQSTCNKDYSCLQGLCPSLVTVEGADLKRRAARLTDAMELALSDLKTPDFEIAPDALSKPYSVLVDGIGGTGVVTIGAWLGMAAHLENRETSVLDMAGLAQKGGAVHSHVQWAPRGVHLNASKIPVGEANLLIGGDSIVSSQSKTLETLAENAFAVINEDTSPTAQFIREPGWSIPIKLINSDLEQALSDPDHHLVRCHAQQIAQKYFGDTVYSNAFLLGVAWQKGWLPIREASILQAIQLNGVQVDNNQLAFKLGRLFGQSPEHFLDRPAFKKETADETFERLQSDLQAYQNRALADLFAQRVQPYRQALGDTLWVWFCKSYYRLLAIKDEFEVARLMTDRSWLETIETQFEPGARMVFHVAPEWMPGTLKSRRKWALGPAFRPVMKLLAWMRPLRSSWLNPFAKSQDYRLNLEILHTFEELVGLVQSGGSSQVLADPDRMTRILSAFEQVKGFGQVRRESWAKVRENLRSIPESKS